MSSGSRKRTRSGHVASLELPPTVWGRLRIDARRADVQLRVAICMLAALAMFFATQGWKPPFAYRSGYVPSRDISARVTFQVVDKDETRERQSHARRTTRCVYENDFKRLEQLRQGLVNRITQVLGAKTAADVPQEQWAGFWPADGDEADPGIVPPDQRENLFKALNFSLGSEADLAAFTDALARAFADFEEHGLLDEGELPGEGEGDQGKIEVYQFGDEREHHTVDVDDVVLLKAADRLKSRLTEALHGVIRQEDEGDEGDAGDAGDEGDESDAGDVVLTCVSHWLTGNLVPTLSIDPIATENARKEAVDSVPDVLRTYGPGDELKPADVLVRGGRPIGRDSAEYVLLWEEHEAAVAAMTPLNVLGHALASLGMFAALYTLCGLYIFYRQPELLSDLRRFSTLFVFSVITVTLCWIGAKDGWRVEIIPLLLFGLTMAIVYRQEVALLLSSTAALIVVLSLGQGVGEFVVLVAALAVSIHLVRPVRSRTKLIYVGLVGAIVALLTTLGVGVLTGQPIEALLPNGVWTAICTLLAAVFMTGLLPFVERWFAVQTDLKLLELGDAAHPLLQELVVRAPGTYNHSINVASIGEAAAKAIGANGLLVRVGAYFHDIGKMLKPEYFIENQGLQDNRHESLLPAMSTLVIIAHVKDGADLARQHGLPNSIVDFILQHHGTTLVEFFYDQANQRSKLDPDGTAVDENNFRYPGPKPQNKETGVMMLADAVEGASRTLVDPTPARIESLVHDLAMKRLLDGQFDECELTLAELHTIENSLAKSLTAVYHARVKYPDRQETA
jgi:putative nucleotidyltransferase with HDIG domain